jgi:hypothetical protein
MSTGLEQESRSRLGIADDCRCCAVGIRPPACPARTANDCGIAVCLSSVPVCVAAGRARGVHEESTPHHAATDSGPVAGVVVVASRSCRVKGP